MRLQLKDLYNAENQLLKALPKMAQAISSPDLKKAFLNHLQETENHVERLEAVCKSLGVKPRRHRSLAMTGLIAEEEEVLKEEMDPDVRDAALICVAQRIEHYEIAGYGCVRTFAERLEFQKEARILEQNLSEEVATDELLTQIAMGQVNAAAIGD